MAREYDGQGSVYEAGHIKAPMKTQHVVPVILIGAYLYHRDEGDRAISYDSGEPTVICVKPVSFDDFLRSGTNKSPTTWLNVKC